MNIVWIDGGLGNQMFQYALALKLNESGIETKIDVTKYAEHHVHNDFELERVFGISGPYANLKEIRRLGYRKANHLTEFLKRTPFRKRTIYNYESYTFNAQVLNMDGCYLEGYWQCEKYFEDIRDIILKEYTFPAFAKDEHFELAEEMGKSCSVSVHIRRGDYLRFPKFLDICTLDYYRSAIRFFRERYAGKVKFFIFSNDFPWVAENLNLEDGCFVEGNTGVDSFRDMQLMSLCKHNIIANSSFSWWGAWLNQNPGKIVIAPEKWINSPVNERIDIVPESWIKMKG